MCWPQFRLLRERDTKISVTIFVKSVAKGMFCTFYEIFKGLKVRNQQKTLLAETFEKRSISFKIKAREDFNHRNILNISRIKIRMQRRDWADKHRLRKGAFCKGLATLNCTLTRDELGLFMRRLTISSKLSQSTNVKTWRSTASH